MNTVKAPNGTDLRKLQRECERIIEQQLEQAHESGAGLDGDEMREKTILLLRDLRPDLYDVFIRAALTLGDAILNPYPAGIPMWTPFTVEEMAIDVLAVAWKEIRATNIS